MEKTFQLKIKEREMNIENSKNKVSEEERKLIARKS